jgi:hypothetical protein
VPSVVESPRYSGVIFFEDLGLHGTVLMVRHGSETLLFAVVALAEIGCEQVEGSKLQDVLEHVELCVEVPEGLRKSVVLKILMPEHIQPLHNHVTAHVSNT